MDLTAVALQAKSLMAKGDLAGARQRMDTLLQVLPDEPQILGLAGMIDAISGNPESALELFTRAGYDKGQDSNEFLALAKTHAALSRWQEAIGYARRAVELAPDNDQARIHLADLEYQRGANGDLAARSNIKDPLAPDLPCFQLLRNGQMEAGFAQLFALSGMLEGKPGAKTIPSLSGPIPRWEGQPVDRLFILTDQGLGDCLQLARYCSRAQERAAHSTIATYPTLVRLFRQSGFENVVAFNEMEGALAKSDAYITSFLLPAVLGADYGTPGGYLKSDAMDLGDGAHIGICWAGNPQNQTDDIRSATLADLEPLSKIEGVTFWNLMVGVRQEQCPPWMKRLPIDITDFADTARIVKGLHLVISVDTSVCHLAGALNVPTWIALATRACWRWQRDEDGTAWYERARLFRQSVDGDWRGVFGRMAGELENALRPWCVSTDVFTADECEAIITAARDLPAEPGRLHNGDAEGYRDNTHYSASQTSIEPDKTLTWAFERLLLAAANAAETLGIEGNLGLRELPRVLRYGTGDHFGWHYDERGNDTFRRLSCSVQLSEPAAYTGGDLLVMRPEDTLRHAAPRRRGTAVFFPSDCLHTVTPITSGERVSMVMWCGDAPSEFSRPIGDTHATAATAAG